MRVIFFNIWHGMIWEGLEKFLREQAEKTEIFCFLEVDPDVQMKLEKVLLGFSSVYNRGIKTGYLGGILEGRSIFVRNPIKIKTGKAVRLFKAHRLDAGGMLVVDLNIRNKKLSIGAVHGKAIPGTKLDTPARLEQSKKIIGVFARRLGPKIIGGDFNLKPDTKSIKMFEEAGYVNLIKKFGVKSTRNKVSWDNFKNHSGFEKQYFADYVFVSREVKIKKFEVPYNEISDHLPLILDFDLR